MGRRVIFRYGQGQMRLPNLQLECSISENSNVERNFKITHIKYATDFPFGSEIGKVKVHKLKSSLSAQQSFFTKPDLKSKAATMT